MNDIYKRWIEDEGILKTDRDILKGYSKEEILDNFGSPLAFGTGGLRSFMGLGANKMNVYTVAQITEGLASVLKTYSHGKIVICYDGRKDSQLFAREAAKVMLGNGFTVYLFKELRPTPTLSFAVAHLECDAGIMITASHNPKEYNGYKIYGENAAQVKGTIENAIVEAVKKVVCFHDIPKMELALGEQKGKLLYVGKEIDDAYFEAIIDSLLIKQTPTIKVVYTPLHGTGAKMMPTLLEKLNYTYFTPPEQMKIDPDFSTLIYPNPEEKEAFDLSLEIAKGEKADIIIATDPDADRLGVMVRDTDRYVQLTGNEVGLLLLYHILARRKERNNLPPNGVVLSSIVSSPLGKIITEGFGMNHESVLIGFKYAGEKIHTYEKTKEKEFLFAYEESCGYLAGTYTKDKDGLQAGLLICEMANFYLQLDKTLLDVLDDIYHQFGYSLDALHTFVLPGKEGQEKIKHMMDFVFQHPPKTIGGNAVIQVDNFRDQISITANETNPLPKSNFLKVYTQEATVAFRPSQTEPKVKLYINTWGKDKEKVSEKRQEILQDMIHYIERSEDEKL